MKQLLFDVEPDLSKWTTKNFSSDNYCVEVERQKLEEKYIKLTEVSDGFCRQSVSFQLSKKDCVHRWLKYKEGFSSDLVKKLLEELNVPQNGLVLDPFMGSGTTAMVCKTLGINSIGFDVLPMSEIAIKAKESILEYDMDELKKMYNDLCALNVPKEFTEKFPYISITYSAFPCQTEKEVVFYTKWVKESHFSELTKNLVMLCFLNSLEVSSYTRKDGQYLAWDTRSLKIQEANKKRIERGAKPINRLNKGDIPSFKESFLLELSHVIEDIEFIQNTRLLTRAVINFKQGSSLVELAKLDSEILDGAITSPPYCNRYDYTRTYALELNYLGYDSEQISKMRQDLISCTVENKSKEEFLRDYYQQIGHYDRYEHIMNCLDSVKAFNEIKTALQKRNDNGEINNKGVLRMVEGYFMDLAFIYGEIYRLFKPGASIAVVNDNVRYAGEVIPVDFLSSEIAEKLGFKVKKIYTLKQTKGNSSQQMAKYGKVALRKSITIWTKE